MKKTARKKWDVEYFDIQADFGFTKHMGGQSATEELARLCRITKSKKVLEVGCGVGMTSCYLAEKFGCHVTGIDISRKMVARSKQRAKRMKVEGLTSFLVADAEKRLPFKDNSFDVVICESVNAFVEDKQKAIREYARVAKKGGHVGLNEGVWLTPSKQTQDYMRETVGMEDFETFDGWKRMMKKAGLKQLKARKHEIKLFHEAAEQIRRVDLVEYAGVMLSFFKGFLTNSSYRKLAKKALANPGATRRFTKDIGYGLFVGKK